MKNQNITFPAELVGKIVRGIMENYPEVGAGSALQCTQWDNDRLSYAFIDVESGKQFEINSNRLQKAFALMLSDAWPAGCKPPPASTTCERWDDWLCQCDATEFDAFAQLAVFGEVIYG